jgi:hypothetical protein
MVSSSQIRNRLALFLSREIDLDSFEDWFVQNTWNIHLSGSTAAEALTFAIEESLSEYSSGHLDKKKLCDELAEVLRAETKSVEIADVPQVVWSFRSSAPVTSVPVLAQQ